MPSKEKFHNYDAFVDKFVTKRTTDDCYTPEPVYRAVLDFVGTIVDLEGREIVRPFWPGADFAKADYPDGCIVVDNPPFSILARIIHWYCERGIRFFLFAPALTLFTALDCDVTYVIADAVIKYANGATVHTGFIHNIPSDLRIDCNVDLAAAIDKAQAEPSKSKRRFVYPDNLVTAAILGKLVNHSTPFQVRKSDCVAVSGIDNAKRSRDIFGGGFLLSTRAAAERAAAERAAAERAAAERAAVERTAAERIQLSVREIRLIRGLDQHDKP